jgi:hypothetical protein
MFDRAHLGSPADKIAQRERGKSKHKHRPNQHMGSMVGAEMEELQRTKQETSIPE